MSFLPVRLFPSYRQRRLLRRLIVSATLLTTAACGADNAAAPTTTSAGTNVRIVNSLFQANATDTTPVTIDYLIDSATTKPSALALASPGISTGDAANHYVTFPRGVHSFVARRAGDTGLNTTVYTTTQNRAFLPKQFLTPGIFYTAVVAGIIPETGAIPNGSIPFVLIVNDPLPGAKTSDGVLQARFQVLNAAPFTSADGNGAAADVYITPGSTVPDTITNYIPLASAWFPYNSGSVNVNPGTYVITLRAGDQIVAQQQITFAAGEVHTFVLQSTAAGPPSLANHKLTDILDQQH